MNDTVTAMMERARARAAELAGAANVPATMPAASAGGALGLDDFGGGGMACDLHLKVGYHGMWIKGKDEHLFKSLNVVLNMPTLQITRAVRFGNPPTYYRSYDAVTTVGKAQSWADSIAEARSRDPKCKGDYASADITFNVIEDLVIDGVKLASPEQKLGHSLSVTNKEEFQSFIKKVSDRGWRSETLLVTIGYKPRSNNQTGYKWGVVTLDPAGLAEDGELEAAA